MNPPHLVKEFSALKIDPDVYQMKFQKLKKSLEEKSRAIEEHRHNAREEERLASAIILLCSEHVLMFFQLSVILIECLLAGGGDLRHILSQGYQD